MTTSLLKGNRNGDTKWPENVQNVLSRSSAHFVSFFYQYFYRRCTCFFPPSNLSFWGRSHVCWFVTNEEQKNIGAWRIWYFCHMCRPCLWNNYCQVCRPCLWNNYSVPHMPALFMKSLLPRMSSLFINWIIIATYDGLVYEITIAAYACLVYKITISTYLCPPFFYEITIATYAGLVCETTTDCWAQNGSTHGRVLATFKRRFLSN